MCILFLLAVTLLDVRAILTELCDKHFAIRRILAQFSGNMIIFLVSKDLLYLMVERRVKVRDDFIPYQVTISDFVEVLLDIRCEVITENSVEILYKIISYDHAYLLWQKFSLLCADSLCFRALCNLAVLHRKACHWNLLTLFVTFHDITAAGGKSRNGRSICDVRYRVPQASSRALPQNIWMVAL